MESSEDTREKSSEDTSEIHDFRPPQARVQAPLSPRNSIPTYTTVYTTDLYTIADGLTNGSMKVEEVADRLKEMARS